MKPHFNGSEMNYTPKQYAAALMGALKGKTAVQQKDIAARLFHHLSRARTLKRLGGIVRQAERMEREKDGVVAADIQSASPLRTSVRQSIERVLGKKAVITEAVDPRLLAGIRILIDEETLIDATARRRLATLFQP